MNQISKIEIFHEDNKGVMHEVCTPSFGKTTFAKYSHQKIRVSKRETHCVDIYFRNRKSPYNMAFFNSKASALLALRILMSVEAGAKVTFTYDRFFKLFYSSKEDIQANMKGFTLAEELFKEVKKAGGMNKFLTLFNNSAFTRTKLTAEYLTRILAGNKIQGKLMQFSTDLAVLLEMPREIIRTSTANYWYTLCRNHNL